MRNYAFRGTGSADTYGQSAARTNFMAWVLREVCEYDLLATSYREITRYSF